jgi:membrane-associated protease RseP (regulator of RpoE activity)
MGNQLKWALVALVVGAVAAAGFGTAVALRGDGGEDAALRIEADVVLDEGPDGLSEPPEVEELPIPRLLEERPFVGITIAEGDKGIEIKTVIPGSPAKEAGLKKGDVILAIDGEEVDSPEAVTDLVSDAEPGDELTFTVVRKGKERDIDVRLSERPFLDVVPGQEGVPPGRLREWLNDLDWDEEWLSDLFDGTWSLPQGLDLLDEALTRFLDAQVRFLDEDGEVVTVRAVAGTIKAVGSDGLTVALNDSGEERFSVSDDTHVRRDIRRAELADLKAGDRVLVIVRGEGDEAAAVVAFEAPKES